jgi:hypothetical protein
MIKTVQTSPSVDFLVDNVDNAYAELKQNEL